MGNSGSIPDIGVKLSASGVQDIVNAFSRVRQEGKKTGTETAASLELINGALATMEELLPAISIAIAVDKLADIALGARETAENMGKLSEKTGAAIGTLSALNLVAHDSEVSQESLSNGLIKLAKNQQDASDGSVKQSKAFKDLGITLNDLKTQDPGQLFVTVAQQLNKMPDGAQKAQIAIALFGKAGAELLPMLKSLGTDGFDAVVAKAKKLGLYLSGDTVSAARAAQDAVHQLEDVVNGFGTKLVAGFGGPLATAIAGVADALTALAGGEQGFDAWGKSVGHGVINLAGAFDELWKIIAIGFANADMAMDKFHLAFNAVEGALPHSSDRKAEMASEDEASRASIAGDKNTINDTKMGYAKSTLALAKAEYNIDHPPAAKTGDDGNKGGGGAGGNGLSDQENQKTAQARSAFLQAQADNELAILKLKNQLEEAEDQRSYAAGTLSLDDYYARREARIKAEGDAELAILEKQREAALHVTSKDAADSKEKTLQVKVDNKTATIEDYKELTAAQKAETQATETQDATESKLTQNRLDRSNAIHALSLTELSDQEKLQKASGDKYGAEETELQIEIQQYTELLQKQKKSTDEIDAAVSAYKTKAQAAIDFGRNQEAGSSAMSKLNLGIGSIQDQAANGSISNIAAQTQINQLQKDALETLDQIGGQMLKNAEISGNPAYIDQAKKFIAGNKQLAASLTNVTTAQTYLINQLSTQGISALSEFFTAGISGSKSFSDALGDLATTFENIVAKMVSQLLIFYALQEILGLAGVKADTITSIIGKNPFSSGHESGGYTANVATNQVAGVVHGKEWVATAAQTAKYRPLFNMIMAGTLDKALQDPTVIPRSAMAQLPTDYADSVTGGPGAAQRGAGVGGIDIPAPIVNVTNTTGQPSTQKQTKGAGGQSITQIIIGAVAKDIASGGQVAQTLQTSYGVTRQGVRRG